MPSFEAESSRSVEKEDGRYSRWIKTARQGAREEARERLLE